MSKHKVFFDFEFNSKNNELESDIIEIGCVVFDERGLIVFEFSEYVKPKINFQIVDFIKDLTNIKQEEIDNAESFIVVVESLSEKLKTFPDIQIFTYGILDEIEFIKAAENYHYTGFLVEKFKESINLAPIIANKLIWHGSKIQKLINLKDMCEFFKIPLLQMHKALYDAKLTGFLYFRSLEYSVIEMNHYIDENGNVIKECVEFYLFEIARKIKRNTEFRKNKKKEKIEKKEFLYTELLELTKKNEFIFDEIIRCQMIGFSKLHENDFIYKKEISNKVYKNKKFSFSINKEQNTILLFINNDIFEKKECVFVCKLKEPIVLYFLNFLKNIKKRQLI